MRPTYQASHAIRHSGLTVIECLFAMAVMLIGLIGIAAMVPFAGRQASDSYRIVQGLSAGENALAVFNSNGVVTPTLNAPWQVVEDAYAVPTNLSPGGQTIRGDSDASSFESFAKLYEGDRENGRIYSLYKHYYDLLSGFPATRVGQQARAAVAQNRALGTGFCIDPMFWAQQLQVPTSSNTKLRDRDWGNFRRARFPFYHETYPTSMNPFDALAAGSGTTPRMFRVTMHDPSIAYGTNFKAWLRLPGAIRLATVSSTDVTKVVPEQDRSAGALRGFAPTRSPGGPIVQSLAPETMQSWMATLTPAETTPVVDPSTLPLPPLPLGIYDENPATPIPPPPAMRFYPESYDLAVVVFSRRDTTELLIEDYPTFASVGTVPDGERLCQVTAFGPEHRSSSTFDVEMTASANVSAKIKIGDWVMMSRYVFDNPLTQVLPIRELHKWYRIVGASGDDTFPRTVRVAGQPWDWTLPEIAVFQANGFASSASLPPIPSTTTVVTIIPNVINVYQRTFRVSN